MAAEQVTIQDVETALRRIPHERLKDVLTFIEFTQYQAETEPSDEDEALWAAVEANQAYKERHPEQVERYKSGAEFLKAVADI
ncbi:MAG: hypothetical protein GY864_04730 [Desulfobacterales bacterium]|nr:hypothetical protein [Desulfobacterales bacterium]